MTLSRIIAGGGRRSGPEPPYGRRGLKAVFVLLLPAFVGIRAGLPVWWALGPIFGVLLLSWIADVIWEIRTGNWHSWTRVEVRR